MSRWLDPSSIVLDRVYETPNMSPPEKRRFQAICSELYMEFATLSVSRMEL